MFLVLSRHVKVKKFARLHIAAIILLCWINTHLVGCSSGSSGMTTVHFTESDSIVPNPGQGWMTMRPRPDSNMRFPYMVVYRSFNWVDAEPEQGKMDFALLDSVIAAWKPRGATIAFRVMTTNPHSHGYYASPKWLFDRGCKGFEYKRGGGTYGGELITRIEPDYTDSLYLKYHSDFLRRMAEHYDGSPDIEFIDIGSYGMWGEWHTSNWAPLEIKRRIVDMYLHSFRKTQLVFMSDGADLLEYGLEHGTGMRRDGVGSTWHEQNWIGSDRYTNVPSMADAWKHNPIVFEWYGNYDYLRSQSWSFDAAINFILRNHATVVNDNVGNVPANEFKQLDKIAKLVGARLVPREITHSTSVRPGQKLSMSIKMFNAGVGKLYYPYVLRFYLLDNSGRIVAKVDGKSDCRKWLSGENDLAENIAVPASVSPGEYSLGIALEDPAASRRSFSFAIDTPQSGGRYLVSKINVIK